MAGGDRVGLVRVRLYRPFSNRDLLAALPSTVKAIAVLDRTKEPGSAGEPLYQDVVTAMTESLINGGVFRAVPARHRGALRAGFKRVHARDG